MRQPSDADIKAAKEYLRQRLDAERAMSSHVEAVMRQAAEKIVGICYSAGVNPRSHRFADLPVRLQFEIDAIIREFEDDIDDYFETLAIADHDENRDAILPLILGERGGMTFGERLTDYCDKYRDELMLLIGAGFLLGITKTALAKSIGDNLRRPYANPLLAGGIGSGISYGRGRTNSMMTAISDLTRYGIAEAWMKNQYINNRKDGCLGWWVRRGSSYPCELCDSYVGFHAYEDDLPPYHGHCCCLAIPMFL